MTRIGRPPRTTTGRRIACYADTACRYITNLLLAVVVLAAYAA